MPPKTIFFATGEVSGDMHAAALAKALKAQDPTLKLVGMGANRMRDAGVHLIADITSLSTIGILEPLRFLPKLLMILYILNVWVKRHRPDVIVLIDNQGFNQQILKTAYKLGIPTVYYIAPQEWQWGTEKGGRAIAALTTKILAIFKPEAEFYDRIGATVTYVGHPLLDTTIPTLTRSEFCQKYNLSENRQILGIFPGSRAQELRYTAPTLLETTQKIATARPDLQILISIAAPHCEAKVRELTQKAGLTNITFVHESVNLIAAGDLSIVTSGTITLEHAILGKPCLVGYKFAHLSYWILKTIFAKKVNRIKFMSLPNLLADKIVLPEFLQSKLTVKKLTAEALDLLTPNSPRYAQIKANLQGIKAYLGTPGVLARAAKEILDLT